MVTGFGAENSRIDSPNVGSWQKQKLSLEAERETTNRICLGELDASSAAIQTHPCVEAQNSDLVVADRLRRIEALKTRLHQLDEALHRIRTGRYGLCTNCGVEISRDRIDRDLATPYCFICQAESECEGRFTL